MEWARGLWGAPGSAKTRDPRGPLCVPCPGLPSISQVRSRQHDSPRCPSGPGTSSPAEGGPGPALPVTASNLSFPICNPSLRKAL